jgi:hypothetical protein
MCGQLSTDSTSLEQRFATNQYQAPFPLFLQSLEHQESITNLHLEFHESKNDLCVRSPCKNKIRRGEKRSLPSTNDFQNRKIAHDCVCIDNFQQMNDF